MGRFAGCLFLLVAACGDNVVGDERPEPLHTALTPTTVTTEGTARLTPGVCGHTTIAVPAGNNPLLDMSIATANGITSVVAVPQAGGSMTGFAVNKRMDVVTDPLDDTIAIDGNLSHVSAAIIGDRPVTATTDGTVVRVHLFDEFLQNPEQIAKIDATAISKNAFMTTHGLPVIVTGGAEGLLMTSFDANFHVGDTKLLVKSAAVTELTTSQYGGAAYAAWSTSAKECFVADVAAFVPGGALKLNVACAHPRLAADVAHDRVALVYEQAGSLRLTAFTHLHLGAAELVLRRHAKSPRIVFDGTRYWVSYIDIHQDVVVGFLDDQANYTSMALTGPKPADDAYELTVIDGRATVVALDAQGNYTTNQLCAVAAAD